MSIDHTVYAVAWENQAAFMKRWSQLGFYKLVSLKTKITPATHIALANKIPSSSSGASMIGLSTSEDPASPINEFIQRYGEGVQHVAYTVDPEKNIDELYEEMTREGWNFLTPVLTYEDKKGAQLKQLWTAPNVPYGQFMELVQRPPLDSSGKTFASFDTQNIEDFYQYYADYSKYLERSMPIPSVRKKLKLIPSK